MRALLLAASLLLLMSLAPPGFGQDADGQYRSKIRIDPTGDLDSAGLSVDELERQINSIAEPYAKSSAGRHLARHFVEQGEYGKAIEYYQTALAASGLSDIANREMLRELAQVYLLQEDYAAAASTLERALRIKLVPEATDYLLLGQAYYRLGKLVQVVGALDPIHEQGLTLTLAQKRQALALYYQAGAYAQCERLLRELLEAEPDDPDNWHQLASVYVQQGKRKQALDHLALAWKKAVPFSEQDIMLLADLQAVTGNPYGAADTLQQALASKALAANGLNYRKLFQFWLQAREKERATAALQQAARLTGDIELYLYLAQLQMEQEAWPAMQQTMLGACKKQLADKYVSRANLLLGISQLKLGDEPSARRSFINATLIGGASGQAGQWLEFMNAAPVTDREARQIVGVCHGSRDKRAAATTFAAADTGEDTRAEAPTAAQANAAVQTKTVPALRLFYLDYDKPLAELTSRARSLAMQMGVALVKSGGSIDGPLQIVTVGEAGENALQLAFPVKGAPRAGGKYKIRQTVDFNCAYLLHEGDPQSLAASWKTLAAAVQAAGHELTGEARLVLQGSGGAMQPEIQLGIK